MIYAGWEMSGDVQFKKIFDVKASHRDIQELIEKLHSASVIPISAGGDRSITLPILRAIGKDKPVGLIHVDAHTDCCDEEMKDHCHIHFIVTAGGLTKDNRWIVF